MHELYGVDIEREINLIFGGYLWQKLDSYHIIKKSKLMNLSFLSLEVCGEYPFPVFILITHWEINIKSFSVCINLGMQKSPSDLKSSTFVYAKYHQDFFVFPQNLQDA